MTTKKKFSQLFSKNVDGKKSIPVEIPRHKENDDHGEFSGTQKLFRSKSGRIKENTKVRISLAKDTFIEPEERTQSAPVISISKPGIGLTGRDLAKFESLRISQSLQFLTTSKETSMTGMRSSKTEQHDSTEELVDTDEVF